MPYIQTLFSGSSGNSTLVSAPEGKLLVDMGRSCRMTLGALYGLGLSASDLSAVLITHEHIDHVAGLATFLKHYRLPVYGLPKCLSYLLSRDLVPRDADLREITPGSELQIAGAGITPFRTNHDSLDCCGYRFQLGSGAAAIATDIGRVTEEVYRCLEGCRVVALESNYDDGALLAGRYPFSLKQRIRSDFGHLSNHDCAETCAKLASSGTSGFFLMHVSEENNSPSLAKTTFNSFLENCGCPEVQVEVAPRNNPGPRFSL